MNMDYHYMKLAIQLAQGTLGQTSPNPNVGAIVVNKDGIVGLGAHLKAGEKHAEIIALEMAGDKAIGSTLYVTLEPCSHQGRTGPCAKYIIEKKVKRVVIATKDPNPLVSGRGIEMLKKAGIDVEVGILEDEAKKLNPFFNHFISKKIPYITLKCAMSLDGKIATESGESKWITSKESRLDSHYYRFTHDAILVGVGTIIKDNPSLTNRIKHSNKNPVRIILDKNLNIPLSANVLNDNKAETWIICSKELGDKENELKKRNCKLIKLDDPTCLRSILQVLGSLDISSVLVEGGAKVHSSFLREGLYNQIIAYIAPKILGGNGTLSPFSYIKVKELNDAPELNIVDIKRVGVDIKVTLTPKTKNIKNEI